MNTAGSTALPGPPSIRVRDIAPVTPSEAVALERVELERLIDVLEQLPGEAWIAPVADGRRTVHDLVAHVAGSYAARGSFDQLRRQIDPRMIRLFRMDGDSLGDTLARLQIGDRAHHSPDQLIEELRTAGPRAIRLRSLLFRPLDLVPAGRIARPRIGGTSLAPFAAVRELWFHRLDISEAAGHGFGLREEHDARVLAGFLRASVEAAERNLGSRSVELRFVGMGQRYRYGNGDEIDAVIEIDPVTLAKLVAKRRSPAATRERSTIEGDVKTAMVVLSAIHGDR